MSLNSQIIQGLYTAAVSKVRTATLVVNGADLLDPVHSDGARSAAGAEASGLIAYLNITAVGTGTLQLTLEEQDPVSLTWSTVAATTAANTATLVKLKLKASITAVAASATGVVVQDVLPGIWRLRVIHTDGSNYTYSLGVVLYD